MPEVIVADAAGTELLKVWVDGAVTVGELADRACRVLGGGRQRH